MTSCRHTAQPLGQTLGPLSLALFSLLLVAFCQPVRTFATTQSAKPNVIVILTDNHGAWTLGCYGNPEIRTPHIDRLAKEGTLFDQAYASNPVCSPTRATLLTGLLPSQHGVHCFLRGGRLQTGEQARNTLADFRSMGEVFRDAGYRCGLVGKWHLGGNMSPQEGLDDEWVTMPHGGTTTFYDARVIEDGKMRTEPQYLTEFWTERSVKFIEKVQQDERPFFLYLAYNGPYGLGRLLLREPQNRHAELYKDFAGTSFPKEGIHPWQYNNLDYLHNPVSNRRVAAEVSAIDDGVGSIVETLEKLNLSEDTLIVFLADQGWVGGHGGFYGMGDHTRPVTARDGMMKIPMIWWQPKRIQAGQRAELMVANYDVLPTLLNHVDLELGVLPQGHPQSPGRDFSAMLTDGDRPDDWKDEVVYEFESLRCIRTKRWKFVKRHPYGPDELYDMEADPNERINLSESDELSQTRRKLADRLNTLFSEYVPPKYDLWKGGESQTVLFVNSPEPPKEESGPAKPPQWEVGYEAAKLEVPPGLEVELVAAPPLVRHPLMGCFDDRGRLYLAESAGLNLRPDDLEQQLPNFVRRIEDTDGDGVFDKSTMFADKMTFPQGALWHDGALYVAAPPNIWRLEDTNDDGVADKREVIVDRFGYNGNGASVHGCFLSPNGRIYWCDGRHGHEFSDEEGNVVSKRDGSYVFSCRPDGSDVQVHCGGGMDNPVEVDFTDSGEVIGTVNILNSRPRYDCLVHWLHGGTYPHSERVLGEFKRTGDLLGPIHNFGHVAVSGTTRYRSGWLDPSMIDNYFVTIFNTGKVQRVEMERDGASYSTTQREFLTSLSKDFHPTDVLEDADGSLLVIDTGGWFRIGCPTSQIAKPEIAGGIYRVRRKGSPSFLDPWGKNIDWPQLSATELTALLNDTRFKVRERAVTEFVRRGDISVPTLQRALGRSDIRARLGAVWALCRIGTDPARTAVRIALQDRDEDVRVAACLATGTTTDTGALPQLIELLQDESAAVRREAAASLGKLRTASASGPILTALESPSDRSEEHSLIYALIEINQPSQVTSALTSSSATVQRGALWALDQMDDQTLTVDQVAPLLGSESSLVRDAALQVFVNHAQWNDQVATLLDQWIGSPNKPGRAELIAGFVTTFAGSEPVAQVIGSHLDSKSPKTVELLIHSLGRADRLPLHDSWKTPLTRALSSPDGDQLTRTLVAVASIATDQFDDRLNRLASDESTSVATRLLAVEAITRHSPRLEPAAFDFLVDMLSENSSPQERTTSARVLSNSSLTAEQLQVLADSLPIVGPLELRLLIQPFRRHFDVKTSRAFLQALAASRSFSTLAQNEVSDVVKGYPEELLDESNRLLSQLKALDEAKRKQLDQLIAVSKNGDAVKGRKTFFAAKSKCSSCHRIGKDGGQIGPDLTAVGRIRDEKDLLESIVFPSASLAREFEPYTVLLADGRVISGIIVHETQTTLHVQQAEGKPLIVSREEVESIVPSTISVMPQGIHKSLSEKELADLVSFLRTLKN